MDKYKKDSYKVPVYSWCKDVEESAQKQVDNIASLPFAFHHLALMPDAHAGMGMPIGGVFASLDVVVPNMVGVDIGCGVAFAQTNIKAKDVTEEDIKKILGQWRKDIPVGFNIHDEVKYDIPSAFLRLTSKEWRAIGTLGGGNHFLELTRDYDGNMCVLLHSGSRNFGKTICDKYNTIAKQMNFDWYSAVDPSYDLAFLPVDSNAGQEYLHEMSTALDFAKYNRAMMLSTAIIGIKKFFPESLVTHELNCHHNYVEIEHHFGKNVWVHRKGAIRAWDMEPGIIPGSMGTSSFLVRGVGNPMSFCSASHGAGRRMSRTEANNTISLEQANESIKDIVFGRWETDRRSKKVDVSESPLAYKSIDEVMEQQTDLVEIMDKLTPMGCVKG